jgi:hypothetical protein
MAVDLTNWRGPDLINELLAHARVAPRNNYGQFVPTHDHPPTTYEQRLHQRTIQRAYRARRKAKLASLIIDNQEMEAKIAFLTSQLESTSEQLKEHRLIIQKCPRCYGAMTALANQDPNSQVIVRSEAWYDPSELTAYGEPGPSDLRLQPSLGLPPSGLQHPRVELLQQPRPLREHVSVAASSTLTTASLADGVDEELIDPIN